MFNPSDSLLVFGQSSTIQGERVHAKEQPQRGKGLPQFQSEPSFCSSGTTSLQSVGLTPSVTHGSENITDRLDDGRTTSNFNRTSDGFYSSSAEFFAPFDGQRHSYADYDKSLCNLSSNHKNNAQADSSKCIADLDTDDTNITDQPDFADLSDIAVTRQAAAKILMDYGLDQEDLDELISCPSEQTTAKNLPRTLWQIRMKKAMRAATTNRSTLCSEIFSPTRDCGLDAVIAPQGVGIGQAIVPPTTGQHSKVVDFGHFEKHTAVVDRTLDFTDSAAKSKENVLRNEEFGKEPPLEGIIAEKSRVFNLISNEQTGCVTSVNLKINSESPADSGLVKLLQNEPNRSLTKSKAEVSKSSLMEKNVPIAEVVPVCGLFTGIIPKHDLVSMKGNDISSANGQMDIQGEAPKFTENAMDHAPAQLVQQLLNSQICRLYVGQTVISEVVPADKPISLPYLKFPAKNDSPLPQFVTDPCSSVHLSSHRVLDPAQTNTKPSTKKSTAKGLPSVTMMLDFAGVTPRKFSHTCSLCKKTCTQMKEWISHKNTSLHLKNCKDLREQYPNWDGNVPQLQRRSSGSFQTSQPHPQKIKAKSRSRSSSQSPVRYWVSENRGEQFGSRTRSHSRSWSPQNDQTSTSRNRSCSSSLEKNCSPRRSLERRLSPRRSRERRLSPRSSKERLSSPWRSRERRPSPRRSRQRSPSPRRSRQRSPSPRRSRQRSPSPRRSRQRSPSPRRSRQRSPSPRRSRQRSPSPRRSRQRSPSPRRSRVRHLSPWRSTEQRSLSRSSRERSPLPRRSRERRSLSSSREPQSSPRSSRVRQTLPKRSGEQQFSPWRKEEKRLSPRLSHERSPSSKRMEEQYSLKSSPECCSSAPNKDEKQSSFTKSCKRKASLHKSSSPQKKPCSLENLTERLLKTPVVQSLSEQQSVEDMVKTMIPVVLEELAKMNSSSCLSSPQSLSKLMKDSSSSPLSGGSSFLSAGSTSSSSAVKVEKSSNGESSSLKKENSSPVKSKFSKPSPPTMVKLKGTFDTLCHSDLISAMDIFGKTKSVLLFKPKQEARVCFEKEEAALKLKASKNFEIKGVSVTVVPEKDVVFDGPTQTSTLEQKNPQLNSSDLSVTTSQTISTGSTTVLSFKKLLSLPEKPQTNTTGKPLTESKSLTVKGKMGSTKKTVTSLKTRSVTDTEAIESALVEKEQSMQQGRSAETEDSKQEPTESQKSSEETVLLPKETLQTDKPADVEAVKPSKEVLASKAEMSSTAEQMERSATNEKLEEPSKCATVGKLLINTPENPAKLLQPAHRQTKMKQNKKELSESTVSECQPVPSKVQLETLDTKDQESILKATDKAEVIQTKDATASEMMDHAELVEVVVEAKNVLGSKREEKNREYEPKLKVETSAVEEENKTDQKTLPNTTNTSPPLTSTLEAKPDMPSTDPLKKPQDNQWKPPETAIKAATQTQAPEPSRNQSAGASAEGSEAKMTIVVETKTHNTAKTQWTPASTFSSNVSAVPTLVSASAKTQQNPKSLPENKSLLRYSQLCDVSSYITQKKFSCIQPHVLFSRHFSPCSTLVLITNLPKQNSCPYTEKDVVNVLCRFGFKYANDNIYIFPGKCMALVLMPNKWTVIDIIKASHSKRLTLEKRKLFAYVVTANILMSPLGFYKSVLKMGPFPRTDDERVVYIQEISPSEIEDLITVLKKIGSVTNYLPLVNKVFIEFETMYDTDRLGIWYSLLKRKRDHKVCRLKTPQFTSIPQPPRFPMKALPKSGEIIDGAAIVPSTYTVPPGSTPPFWVAMTTSPYVFPTVSPWFSIPAFLTVQNLEDINKASPEVSAFSTVMLTGLPEGNYTKQDVAKRVESYFSKDALNHKLMILPLQRRAFVWFCSWDDCCSFIHNHIKSPVSVQGCKLHLHLVLEDLRLGSSEDLVYKTLMNWSHIYTPELDCLEDRLLCVETFEAKLDLIKRVMTEVASAASFVNFLPLANKIWVEMTEVSGVGEVMEKLSLMKELSKDQLWSKVGHIETLKNLKQRLKDASEVRVDLTVAGQPAGTSLPPASEPTDAGSAEPESASGLTSAAPQKEQSGTKQPQTAVNTPGPGQVRQNTVPEPRAPVEGLTPAGGSTDKKAPVAAATTVQTDPTSKGICSKPTEVKRPPLPNNFKATDNPSLTAGEKIGTHLHRQISCLSEESIQKSKYFSIQKRLILITNLPEFHDDCYSEADIISLLQNFGFQYEDTNIYVIPQSRMAFVLMPSFHSVQNLIKTIETKPLTLQGCRLHLHVVTSSIIMTPFGFYKSLMALINVKVTDDGASTIYIHNISPSESRLLRQVLLKIDSVKNYLPLLNKVFVEFESIRDADRLGVWYSLLKNCPAHSIFRMKIPRKDKTSLPPRLAAKALPNFEDLVPGAVVPATNCGVPLGSTAPFSVTLTTAPFVFPTMSPWFKIPDFVTVFGLKDTMKAKYRASKFSTIMLTNLPEGNYSHRDVAKQMWHYFSAQNLQTLFYKVVILPLQRRAFVCFDNWSSCCRFVQNHGCTPVSVRSSKLKLHLVLEEMQIGSSEETLFRSLMKWSNSRVPELKSLEERLLCVHISEVSVQLIILVLKTVQAIAPFVSFLPLANRICIEMAEASGVTQVVNNISDTSEVAEWSKVQRVESLKTLKQRLKEQNQLKITLDGDDSSIKTIPSTAKTGAQLGPSAVSQSKHPTLSPAKPAASTGSSSSKSIAGGPSDRGTKETSASFKTVKQEEQANIFSSVSAVCGSTSDNSSTTLIKPIDGVAKRPFLVKDFQTPSTAQTSKTCEEHQTPAGSKAKEAKSLEDFQTLPSKSSGADHQSATTLKQKVQELALQTSVANVNPELRSQPECSAGNVEGINMENSEPGKARQTGQTEPMEVEGSATTSKDVASERLTTPPQSLPTNSKTQDTAEKESLEMKANPESTTQELEPTMNASQGRQQAASSSAGASQMQIRMEIRNEEEVSAEANQRTASPSSPSSYNAHLTPGEEIVQHLKPKTLCCFKRSNILKSRFNTHGSNVLCLDNLPKYEDCCYTEAEIVDMLRSFGVECETGNVFVVLESCMALVYLASIEKVQDFFRVLGNRNLILKGHKLEPCGFSQIIEDPELGIYEYLMKKITYKSGFFKWCIVYVQNISPSDSSNLIKTVKKICQVKNVLPLLNKVFIECYSSFDVDLLGVWFGSQKKHQSYSVQRMGQSFPSHRPTLRGVLNSSGDVTVIQTAKIIPVDSVPPFWITTIIEPYVFYTRSPWFNIPDFWTLNQEIDSKTYSKASQFSTIMLTGAQCFKQSEVLKLVWSYFTEQNHITLSYRVVVLPLQSRVFVFFSSWKECLKFVNDQNKSTSHSKTHNFSVHLVLEDMNPGYCEEDLYRSLMKWSNAHVTETASLEERLLCVEVTATNANLTKTVLMDVARIAPFVNTLPLGNRIYIEMVDSNAAEEVLKKTETATFFQGDNVERILLIESVKSRKERLKGWAGIPVNMDNPSQLMAKLDPQPPALAKGQHSSSSAAVASAGASELLSSSLDKSRNVETEKDSAVQTVKNVEDVPHLDEKTFNAIKAAVRFYKQAQKNRDNQTSHNETPEDLSKDSLSDVSSAVDEGHDTTAAESSSTSMQTSKEEREAQTVHVANEVSAESLELSTTSGSSSSSLLSSTRSSQLSEAHSNPSGVVQTSSPASSDQKSPPPPSFANDCSLSAASVKSEESSVGKEFLKLDETADDKSSAARGAPEMEKATQTQNLETGLKTESPEEMKDNMEDKKDDDKNFNDHKNNQTLNSVDPQRTKEVSSTKVQTPHQEDVPQEATSETQMEAERSNRRRSSRRNQVEKKTQEDKEIVKEPTTSTISTRSSTRRMSENALNDEKVKTPQKNPPPTTRKKLSSGVLDAEVVDTKENPTPARPRGRPRKRTRPVAGEAEELGQKRPLSHSPSPASDLELPPYDPKTPLGQQFVESKWGFFCKLCSVPYLPKEQHCSSKDHYDNLQKYYQTKQTS